MIAKQFWFLEDYLYKYEGNKANHFHQPPTDYSYEARLSSDRLRPGSIPKQNSNCDFVFENFSNIYFETFLVFVFFFPVTYRVLSKSINAQV